MSLNIISIMGRLVADPELRKTPNGVSTSSFTIACERNFVKTGEQRQTDFIDVVAWRQTAEFACKYFRKGQLIALDGSLQTRFYEDRSGNKRKVHEIVADHLHFAEGKRENAQAGATASTYAPAPTREVPQASAEDFAVIDDSEDLPF